MDWHEDKDEMVNAIIEEHVNKIVNPDMVQMAIHFHMSKLFHETREQEELEEQETEEEYSERISGIKKELFFHNHKFSKGI